MPIDDQTIREFLLGRASAGDDEKIGVRLISDDEELTERIAHAENELVEDHLDGLLSEQDEELFRENFLSTPERLQLVDEVRLLREGLRRLPAGDRGRPVTTKVQRAGFFALFSRPIFAAAALAVLAVAGTFIYFAYLRDTRTPLEVEYAAVNQRDLSDPARTQGLSVISLVPANFRDETATASHANARLSGAVVFRLELSSSVPEGTELPASIESSAGQTFTVPGRVFRNAFGSELKFIVPKEVLQPGQYEIVVRSANRREVKGTYQFRIQ